MAVGPEAKVKDAVKKLFAAHGITPAGKEHESPDSAKGWYYMPVQNGMGVSGIPDFIACVGGQFMAIETKATAAKKPTPLQLRNLKAIDQCGGTALLIHKDNLDGLDALLLRRTGK
jgi:hypothetical protein